MQLFVARRALLHALFEKYVTLTGEKAVKMRRVVEAKLPVKVGPLDEAFGGQDLLSVRCKASYTSSSRPHTLVPQGLIH